MAEYLILLYHDETAYESAAPDVREQISKEHTAFFQANQAVLRGGNALQPTLAATSIRRDVGGELVVTDGAFAETKEVLGGYYLVEAADLDEALAVAKQVPARFGGVEVRPTRQVG